MSSLLRLSRLEAFYGASQVLHGIDLTVAAGEQLALIGRNGMGKTTLLRSLMGLVAQRRGSMLLRDGQMIAAAPEQVARAGVAIVPEGRGIFGSLSVTENLLMAARAGQNGRRSWTLARVLELFPRLAQRRSHGGQQLSGGEQQMLAIARALMTNPDLVLIDEATEGLAPLVAREIWRTLALLREEGIATIVVDKDVRSLFSVADKVLVLSKGVVVHDGPPESVTAEVLEQHLGV